jgi:hypothetical protein
MIMMNMDEDIINIHILSLTTLVMSKYKIRYNL